MRRATLVHRAEAFLLEALTAGYELAEVESAVHQAMDRWREAERQELPAREDCLRFAGSHDLVVTWLAGHFREIVPGYKLELRFSGSLGGLMALADGEVDLAGCHLWDVESEGYNIPFVRRLLPGRRLALLTLAHRSMGLILPPGNPQKVNQLADLARPDSRLVNRQPGSGTRVWVDAQLKALGIEHKSVAGYEREELTHLAVARAVADGEATVGVGIYAAAAAHGLAFIPLSQERYELVIPAEIWDSPAIQVLVEIVHSSQLNDTLATLGGYDTTETGRARWIS